MHSVGVDFLALWANSLYEVNAEADAVVDAISSRRPQLPAAVWASVLCTVHLGLTKSILKWALRQGKQNPGVRDVRRFPKSSMARKLTNIRRAGR